MLRFILFLCLAVAWDHASGQPTSGDAPTVEGYVTAVSSPASFDVNGKHIVVTPQTRRNIDVTAAHEKADIREPIAVGDYLKIFGRLDAHSNSVTAEEITFRQWREQHVDGSAVIDRILSDSGNYVVRADGYNILLPPISRLTFTEPLKTPGDIATNLWLKYSGTLRIDGTVVADTAVLAKNTVSESERKLRERYSKQVIPPDPAQNQPGEIKMPFPYKHLKMSTNHLVQERVNRIGRLLIPSYQQALPAGDPARIDFRFYILDKKSLRGAYSFPGGEVLISEQAVERLQNDDQLAAVLAIGMAGILEKQVYRIAVPANNALLAGQIAGAVGGAFVPGLGLAELAGGYGVAHHLNSAMLEQRSRVSLALMHDAGFDVKQAPVAWQLLSTSKTKDLSQIPLPEHSQYLLQVLSDMYRQTAVPPAPKLSDQQPASPVSLLMSLLQ